MKKYIYLVLFGAGAGCLLYFILFCYGDYKIQNCNKFDGGFELVFDGIIGYRKLIAMQETRDILIETRMRTFKSIFDIEHIDSVALISGTDGNKRLEVNLIDRDKKIKRKVNFGVMNDACWSKFKSATESYLPLQEINQ